MRERILKVDCGYKVPHEFTDMLLPGMGKPEEKYDWGFLSIPSAFLYALKRAFAGGGWLILIPGLASVILGFATIARWKGQNVFFMFLGGVVLAGIYETVFQLVIVKMLGGISPLLMVLGVWALAFSVIDFCFGRLKGRNKTAQG
jgi:hypothetical protein